MTKTSSSIFNQLAVTKKTKEKAKKKKKRSGHKQKQNRQERKNGNSVAMQANTTQAIGGYKKKERYTGGSKMDIFEVTYHNYNKKNPYSRNSKSKKTSYSLGNLHIDNC